MNQVDLLDGVLAKTGRLVAGVRRDQREQPTPCPDFDVASLVDHLVGWLRKFADSATGEQSAEDPSAFHAGDDASEQFDAAAGRAVAAFRSGATDRPLRLTQGELPGSAVVGMMLMEYIGHGWDLATATQQPVPYTEDEAEAALAVGRQMLQPEYRGAGKPFGEEVAVPERADAIQRLVGFLGRQP